MPATNRSRATRQQSAATIERRTRRRLRELCDEVLASYRVAADRDLWTDRERMDARALLARIAPAATAELR